MQQRSTVLASVRATGAVALTLAVLTACGGGGGNTTPATVSSMSIASTKYATPALVTVAGTNLGNLSLTAPGCKNVTRLTASPTASSDTTAYFSCTPSGAYTSSISAVTNSTPLISQTLTVPAPVVTMTVSGGGVNGTIVFNLRGDKAPITVDNFLAYVNSGTNSTPGFYVGTIFHRVVANFVVQGGGYGPATSGTLPTPKATTYAPIVLELPGGGSNTQWTAAMARTSDDNSATSQFFFNTVNNASILDKSSNTHGYAVFADVSTSTAVIQAIAAAPCTAILSGGVASSDGSCVPIPNVVITTATQTQ
jgi:cyclophilin family peptidyl-prolyl cis-trans isomerase